jgi:predicted acyltransferase (DUF342 family)
MNSLPHQQMSASRSAELPIKKKSVVVQAGGATTIFAPVGFIFFFFLFLFFLARLGQGGEEGEVPDL